MKKPMKKFKRYQEGGDVAADKQRGLDISNKEEPVGFFERIRMGNIDEPGSEAYNRFGAGRGRAAPAAAPAPARTIAPAAPAAPAVPSMPAASSRPLSDDLYSDYGPSAGRSSSETVTSSRPMATKPVVPVKPNKTSTASQSVIKSRPMSAADEAAFQEANISPITRATYDYGTRKMSRESKYPGSDPKEGGARGEGGYGSSNVGNQNSLASAIPGQSAKTPKGEKIDSSETSRNIENALLATGAGGLGLAGLYKLGRKAFGGAKAAGAKRLERPGTVAGKDFVVRDYEGAAKTAAKGKPKKQLGYSKDDVTDVTAKKRGGAVKKYASGGMVSSASRRADGIATKGKTRGKIC